ncbi:MAG: 1-(5-phosphoribosyl)-5-[(5-phosphoribosylamino)methylideneamino]imidazole-4-carboxamide isomerase [SAR202 cluster bacterium]|jgi:phosphoribosylformimino-5-aminoimidazole carboxamide ribotide isomerase|nr:1-(5-phosphoribosyl)-5-[(5-phosphoribosylamino)methylideneamino]imidazole-4-carboxamide isomerase [SAR202 cluster bacterium]
MELIPAIDLLGGKCVRLYQGDYGQETVYSEDPSSVAAEWVEAGASRLHVVDLDGARAGVPTNVAEVKGIVSNASVPVQLGGGIRTVSAARTVLVLGVDRVLVGTAAVEDPALVRDMCRELGPEAVVVSVDARGGVVATDGWTRIGEVMATELVVRMAEMGVRRFLYTDIDRDGTLTEPNFEAIGDLVRETGVPVVAAGGISSVDHLLRLADLGVEAAVIGKALYTGDIDFGEAVRALTPSYR